MVRDLLRTFWAIWFIVIVSTITVFSLVRIGIDWFPSTSKTAQERMYDYCLYESNSNHTNNCDTVLKAVK